VARSGAKLRAILAGSRLFVGLVDLRLPLARPRNTQPSSLLESPNFPPLLIPDIGNETSFTPSCRVHPWRQRIGWDYERRGFDVD